MNDRREAAVKEWRTRRYKSAFVKAHAAAAASKAALEAYCAERGWNVWRSSRVQREHRALELSTPWRSASLAANQTLQFRLIQLKGGNAGVSGREIARLRKQ